MPKLWRGVGRWCGRCVHDPLIHFLALGAILAALHQAVAPPATGREIALTTPEVNGLRADFERRNGRPPTPEDTRALIQRFVDNEVMYREALALGLDRGDIIVRRRLIQKMEFLNDDQMVDTPTEADLERYLSAHSSRYADLPRITFTQVFASSDRHADARALIMTWRDALAGGADPRRLGDPFVHGASFSRRSERDITALFGPKFAAALHQLPIREWVAPIPSSYGMHAVRVERREPGGVPSLETVREAVLRDWQEERRAVRRREALAALRRRYDIRIDGFEPVVQVAEHPAGNGVP